MYTFLLRIGRYYKRGVSILNLPYIFSIQFIDPGSNKNVQQHTSNSIEQKANNT